jgi:hypothetical protein
VDLKAISETFTPEQLLHFELRAIFLPRQHSYVTNHFFNPNLSQGPRFIHYTSADAGLKIIKSKRIWMRNTTCMADYAEIHHGFNLYSKFFSDMEKEAAFMDALNDVHLGSAKEALDLFNGWLNDIKLNTYVSSLSEHLGGEDRYGRLSMWRAFGGSTVGRVAFVLKIPALSTAAERMSIMFSPVTYWTDNEVELELFSVISNIKTNIEKLKNSRSHLNNNIYISFARVGCHV